MCNCLGKFWYNLILVIFTLPAWILVSINSCFKMCCSGCTNSIQQCNLRIVTIAWKLVMCLTCCVVSLRKEGFEEVNAALSKNLGKPQLIIFNHNSFYDIIAAFAIFPVAVIAHVKMMASEHLFKMPIVGGIASGTGQFSVPFTDQSTKKVEGQEGSVANFAVDKNAVAKIMEQFEAWVKDGNVGAWFPEGRLNPNSDVLQQFRAGGFKLATHIDCAIYCTVYCGFDVFWHRKSPLGGTPANVNAKAFILCASSFDLIKQLAQGKEVTDQEKCILMANHAQARMQEEYDKLKNNGWVSRPRGSPDLHVELKDAEKGS